MSHFRSLFSRWMRRIGVFALIVAPAAVSAQGFADRVLEGATKAGSPAGLTDAGNLETVVGQIILSLLSLVGVILLVIMIYAGFLWMTAGGNTEQVKKARGMIINAVIGLVIIFSAWAIVDFVIRRLAGPAASGGGPVNQ